MQSGWAPGTLPQPCLQDFQGACRAPAQLPSNPGTNALTGAPQGSQEGVGSIWTWTDRMGRWLGEGFKGLLLW